MGKLRIPPLAVGIGMYLPMSATFAVVVGAVVATWYAKATRHAKDPARAERLGTLVASGMIVGESLFGVLNAGLIVAFRATRRLRCSQQNRRLRRFLARWRSPGW